ncbi:hypothetical protein ABT304_16770 [Nocardioides sp. NPDC000445]|uniref:hypothetical protein n=1 Tax=Nocardioides sp. NPDC000445 TaxID=3154257 RepID=UPI0033289CA0
MLVEGQKIFEDDQSIMYAFEWPGAERSGEVKMAKSEVQARLSAADSDLDPAAAKILIKAYKEARATGLWPDKVIYAA